MWVKIKIKAKNSEETKSEYSCKECGRKAKGDGLFAFRIEDKDFPNISKWWSYMGRNIDPLTGRMNKRKKGVKSTWSARGRNIGWHFKEVSNRQKADTPYKKFAEEEKLKYEKNRPELKKYEIHDMAWNKSIKLFLSHMWHVAREIAGKSTDGPYIQIVKGHTGIIPPYYWEKLQ